MDANSFPLFALGPYTNLNVGYLRATINNTTVTVLQTAARKTVKGFNLVRTTNGVYTITHPKCATCMISAVFRPTVAGDGMVPRIIAGASPIAGTAVLHLSATAAGAAADPSAQANEIDLFFLLGSKE
jgi:hypothetical protein